MLQSRLHYVVSMPKPSTHYFEVQISVPPSKHPSSGKTRLVMPVWTPGSYLVREFSKNVLDLWAKDSTNGRDLPSRKDSKNSWVVETLNASGITVNYRVYSHELTVDTSFLDDRHAIINGASVFMFVEGLESDEILLTVVPQKEWKTVSTGLEPTLSSGSSYEPNFVASNFDILVDSPIHIGNQEVHSFEINGIQHEVMVCGWEQMNHTSLVADIKKITENTWPVFSEIPYSRYVFIIDFSGNPGGGLEHLNSTHCIVPRLRTQPPEEYRQMLGLFSHELFHAWNVKRMRPHGLGPFNYSEETYSSLLWVSEGITSYYDDLILRRAGIYSVGEYLDAFCRNVDAMSSLPSWKFQNAEESSFDTWIKYYRPDENFPNVVSSYYFQGAVIGWMLDMEIRRNTENTKSLDDVMSKLYRETFKKEGKGFSDEQFETACNEICGTSLSASIFEKRVRGREKVDFDKYLSYAGLNLAPRQKSKDERERGFLGVRLRTELGKPFVASRLFESPAESGGLSVGDEIIAADGIRLDSSTFPFYVSNKSPESAIRITVARNGVLIDLICRVGARPVFEHRIYKVESAEIEQKDLFLAWVLQDWNEEIRYPEYVPSPIRKQTLDYV